MTNPRFDMRGFLTRPHASRDWERLGSKRSTTTTFRLVSQEWRGFRWTHEIRVRGGISGATCAFLYVGGKAGAEEHGPLLDAIVASAGVPAAIVTGVPNQPLMGMDESALLAYTLSKHGPDEEGDWPLLFPMAKSIVAAMDALSSELGIERFIVSGSSKRAWAAWLAAAHDGRVVGLAPFSFELINIPAQISAAREAYGADSESLAPYSALGLTDEVVSGRLASLAAAVDAITFKDSLGMPKLVTVGTNDPFWVVDSHRHYFEALPGSKSLFLVPNAGHDVAGDPGARAALAAWSKSVANDRPVPPLEWRIDDEGGSVSLELLCGEPPEEVVAFAALSPTSDFRASVWTARPIRGTRMTFSRRPGEWLSFFVRARFAESGLELSTPAFVSGLKLVRGKVE